MTEVTTKIAWLSYLGILIQYSFKYFCLGKICVSSLKMSVIETTRKIQNEFKGRYNKQDERIS